MQKNFLRTLALFNTPSKTARSLGGMFEDASGVPFGTFFRIAHVMYGLFAKYAHLGDYELRDALEQNFARVSVSSSVRLLSATRSGFRKYYENYKATVAWQIPYEFNPLLRFPVLSHNERYWCAYPQLINYAATRGLYFYLLDAVGSDFTKAFSTAFETYVAGLCKAKFGEDNVITEEDERKCGWEGKTNDITVLLGDTAFLFECKNSGLFGFAKRTADPKDLLSDARKTLANSKHRQGLYQLHDKIANIRSGALPGPLSAKYASLKRFYPVLLLHEEIHFANRPECLKNIVDSELKANGISGFDYQIWYVEELENLLQLIPIHDMATAIG
jgi:hypothetical protein